MITTEAAFLIKLAIDKYNSQFGTNIGYDAVRIRSIEPNANTDLGYELVTNVLTDNLRLRVYFIYGTADILYDYRVEVDRSFYQDRLGDEIFVTLGTINTEYLTSGTFKFHWISVDDSVPSNAILSEIGSPIITEDGIYLVMEAVNG